MTTPVGRPTPTQDLPPPHPLEDPIGFPLAFKQWIVQYLTQELQLHKLFGYQAPFVRVGGIVPAAGTTATAGSGFTYTHTDTSGIYVFTFTTGFAATPMVFATSRSATVLPIISSVSATGFTVTWRTGGGTATDTDFNFVAQPTS